MSNLIEITAIEAAALIGLDDANVLPVRFGGGRAWLDLDSSTNVFTDALKKMRLAARSPSSHGARARTSQADTGGEV